MRDLENIVIVVRDLNRSHCVVAVCTTALVSWSRSMAIRGDVDACIL